MSATTARPVRPVRRVVLVATFLTVTSAIACALSGGDLADIVYTTVITLVGSMVFGLLADRREVADMIRARQR